MQIFKKIPDIDDLAYDKKQTILKELKTSGYKRGNWTNFEGTFSHLTVSI